MPWSLKRLILISFFGYEIDAAARIGFSWIYPSNLIMKSYSKIGSLSVAVHLDLITMEEYSSIGRSNWITGFSSEIGGVHFTHQIGRKSTLMMGEHSALTKNHHIDCTSSINIGKFSTIAGYQSQLLTHSIDILENRQDSKPIVIGNHCFIGTNSVILGGSVLPSFSVLGAKSLLNKSFSNQYFLYGGVPAQQLTRIPSNAKYFLRTVGFVY